MHHGGGGGAGGGYGHSGGAHHGGHHASHHHGGEPSQSLSWNMAMQADPFWVKLLKANAKPLVLVVGGVGVMVLWLNMIHTIHGKEDPNHVVAADVWNQQLTAVNPREQMPDPSNGYGQTNSAPSAFGAPRSPYESSNTPAGPSLGGGASGNMPSLAPMLFSHYMPGGYAQGQGSSTPLSLGARAGASGGALGLAMPQQQQLIPIRAHSTERYRMVVNR